MEAEEEEGAGCVNTANTDEIDLLFCSLCHMLLSCVKGAEVMSPIPQTASSSSSAAQPDPESVKRMGDAVDER